MPQLDPAVVDRHMLPITATDIGLGHYIGSIPDAGMVVTLAVYLAAIMGKAMLETRGFV